MTNQRTNTLIVGASSGIGLGFVRRLLTDGSARRLFATYRRPDTAGALLALQDQHPALRCLRLDVDEESDIAELAAEIAAAAGHLNLAVNCAGILHTDGLQPEKNLRQVNGANLRRYFATNSIGPVLLAKHLLPLFRRGARSVLATLSAKGGWCGYRASKAALNMLLKTAAVEYARNRPDAIVALLHPGTTDTPLSAPFQGRVPAGRLFSVDRTVAQLLAIIDNLTAADSGSFIAWDGSRLPW